MNNQYDFVLFDWNGTLVDDIDINIDLCDTLLKLYDLPTLPSREFYLEHFDFPIKPFYELLGFDWSKHNYEKIAVEYGEIYAKEMKNAKLFPDVVPLLEKLTRENIKAAIISASMQKRLIEQTSELGISPFFSAILGAKDNLGESKVERCKSWLILKKASPDRVLFVGDTTHDAETAAAAGLDCVLISRGHNSLCRLQSTGYPVYSSLAEAFEL